MRRGFTKQWHTTKVSRGSSSSIIFSIFAMAKAENGEKKFAIDFSLFSPWWQKWRKMFAIIFFHFFFSPKNQWRKWRWAPPPRMFWISKVWTTEPGRWYCTGSRLKVYLLASYTIKTFTFTELWHALYWKQTRNSWGYTPRPQFFCRIAGKVIKIRWKITKSGNFRLRWAVLVQHSFSLH